MIDHAEASTDEPLLPAPDEVVLRMRHAIHAGEHWFLALLDAVGQWRLPVEERGGRRYEYLIGGEAFDWLLLAERLLDEASDLVPAIEARALIFDGHWPLEMDQDEFAERIGRTKHSAHLNFLYGVLVEEALQLSVEEEIHKENFHRAWGQDPRVDETALQRIYGRTSADLYGEYLAHTGVALRGRVTYGQWKAFTYFLFKRRLRQQDKARVASDTRKGLAQLTRMELAVAERRNGRGSDHIAAAAARATRGGESPTPGRPEGA